MEEEMSLSWEVGTVFSTVQWQNGECLESPKLKTKDGVLWWLEFYPAGDDEDTEGLVFWLYRSDTDKEITASLHIHLCFYTVPVRQYMLHHTFEKGEESHKWMIVDIRNVAQLKIFIPPSSLCIHGFLTVREGKHCDGWKNAAANVHSLVSTSGEFLESGKCEDVRSEQTTSA